MNSKVRGLNQVVNISEKFNDKNNLDGKNLLLNCINRGLAISHYRKKGIFYRTNSCTIFNYILYSTVTSTK